MLGLKLVGLSCGNFFMEGYIVNCNNPATRALTQHVLHPADSHSLLHNSIQTEAGQIKNSKIRHLFLLCNSGQTGTGKTYTMMGEHGEDLMAIKPKVFTTAAAAAAATLSSSRLGIIPRAVQDLFRAVAERQQAEGITVQVGRG